MKHNHLLCKLLCLALAACTLFTLCACQTPSVPDGACTHSGGTATCAHSGGTATCQEKAVCEKCGEAYGSLAAHTYENGTCTVCGAAEGGSEDAGGNETGDGKPVPDNYENGAAVSGGGATIPAGSFAVTETVYDESTAEEIKANTFFRTAARGPGKVFRITDGSPLMITGIAGQDVIGSEYVVAERNKNVFGPDVELDGMPLIPDDV